MSTIGALNALGFSVPDDIPVVGYDNIGQASLFTPSLTTIDQNIALGGETLVDLLLKKLAGEPAASTLTQTRLIVRGSTIGKSV